VLEKIEKNFFDVLPVVDFCSLRFVRRRDEAICVRQDVPQPFYSSEDVGAMITVMHGGSLGYAATSDLTAGGLRAAAKRAVEWASRTAGRCVIDFRKVLMAHATGDYEGPNERPWASASVGEKFDLLVSQSRRLKSNDAIVDWSAWLWHSDVETLYLTSGGGRVFQQAHLTGPGLRAAANAGAETQSRTFGGNVLCRQGGLEVVEQLAFTEAPETVAAEAAELLAAPDCPSGKMDLLLAPDQMVLQIHESIGHPLELDRILGDERNYAGTSFVRPEMLGSYRYGSELLNIVFDPTCPQQLASYGFDDDGLRAERTYLIKAGILLRAIGGTLSQARSGLPGLANSRAESWKRPPIDRMANLNLEPGGPESPGLEEMIGSVERGIYMKTNRSWSIDDSRNKFQFGCEWGRLIEDGKLTKVVKNANYRGISAAFWRSLQSVGNPETHLVMGTPNCGKGEPNQMMYVSHASPACLFAAVDVFGGA
jgi:predicted Zn-dependent protease